MSELPAEAATDLTRPMDLAVAPGGDRVAVQTFEFDGDADRRHSSVLVVPTDGSRDPYRLTRASDARAMRWSPDGSKLGVVAMRERDIGLRVENDGSAEDGDENDDPAPQLWVYDLERGGDARQVTDFAHGIADFDWGPAGERVAVAARDPTAEQRDRLERRRDDGPKETERLQHHFDGEGWLDSVTTCLFVVDVATRERRRLDDAHSGGAILDSFGGLQPAWHPEADRIAFCTYHGDDAQDTYVHDVHVVEAETGAVERVTDGEYMASHPRWSPDGTHLAFAAANPTNWYVPTDVCVADEEERAYRSLTDGLDRTLAWFEDLAWLDDDTLLTAIGDEGWSRFVTLAADGEGAEPDHERVYDALTRDWSLTGFDTAGGTVAFVAQHPQRGIDVFGLDRNDLAAAADDPDPRRRLTECNPALVADYDHPEVERVTVTGADGDDVEAVTFLPPEFDPDTGTAGDPGGDHPLLLSIHGGPRRYDEPHFDVDTAFWATRGYVVCKVNYHGSTSYGRAFSERLGGDWNGVEVTDLLAATDELVERGWVDPDRLFVTGFSYGGRATAYVLTATDRFAAGVAEHGSYDLRAAFGTDDSHKGWEQEFGLPWERPEAYDEASSITDVDDIDTPLMLTAGEDDLRCRSTQAEQLYVALRKRGVDSKLVVYDTSHVHYFVAQPERATHRLETMESWFERHDPTVEADGNS